MPDPLLDDEKREKALAKSRFRASFRLTLEECSYLEQRGAAMIRNHAMDFVTKRLVPAMPKNDGKQTPRQGHPVFKAQHATATCCRGCLQKWYGIEKGKELTPQEVKVVLGAIMKWLDKKNPKQSAPAV